MGVWSVRVWSMPCGIGVELARRLAGGMHCDVAARDQGHLRMGEEDGAEQEERIGKGLHVFCAVPVVAWEWARGVGCAGYRSSVRGFSTA